MLRVIAYDVKTERRRRRIREICRDYGVRQQYSVFVCDLAFSDWERFLKRLSEVIEPKEDSVMVFPLCEKCRAAQIILGRGEPYEKPRYYLF